ncbi:bifunctional 5,10-methylenetetrahydrofolate dehydrogenase/5,10-methenyltetrahydrofolate cyclohydrolase [Crateriforma conspicua]|uniref:Bifunctional protein FolD n=1 Tax=Crateriforma conspicua TaxID=2527996 RepID=A0A5C5Y7F1_9PLAN|nr:bifunctional 5,10-methylenetetrahydrofolate dehydrogenase/5,10-methenyltetrahydrofolate cyclohydrolase [Crateriforma conspicua]QDV65308.1 Tetrahydrofolate dehydrogenase/cyclohydrolase [Crateriforma conspicua]TWT70703.1 Tetrahydrofolate dehydrogenase/cyclohydrolase [Crateriforma conspicua]
MTATLLNGKQIAQEIRAEIAEQVRRRVQAGKSQPKLCAILVGDDPASQVYVRNKERACEKAGIAGTVDRLPATTTGTELLARIEQLNHDPTVHGILVQLPLPKSESSADPLDERRVLDAVSPLKDVDAFSPVNVGLLMQGRPRFLPCTPHGVVQLLHRCDRGVAGKHVVVIGRSDIVGKPIASMLSQRTNMANQGDAEGGRDVANATVTIAHSRTENLADLVRQADCVIAAVGIPKLVTADMIRPGATVVDVGINRVDDKLVGDVDFEGVKEVAGAITPVPGGVGPLTIAMLLHNTVKAAELADG